MRRFQTFGATTLAVVIVCAAFTATSHAWQQPTGMKARLAELFTLSQQAKSVEQLTEAITECEATADSATGKTARDYCRKLAAWAYNRRGEAYAGQATKQSDAGNAEQAAQLDRLALADFEAAIERDAKRWKALQNRGVSLAMQGDYESALADFSKVVQLQPEYQNAWFNRGEIRYELGDFKNAVADYTQALDLKSDDAASYASRGHAYFQLADYTKALADYSDAVRLQPQDAGLYATRADAYRSLGNWPRAAQDYQKAIRLDDALGVAYQGAAWLMATCPDPRFRDSRQALLAAERAIELDGQSDYQYLDTLAAALASNGQYEEALAAVKKALEACPEEQRPPLRDRQALYETGQPYRQQ